MEDRPKPAAQEKGAHHFMKDLTTLIMTTEAGVSPAIGVDPLQPICGTPILRWVCDSAARLGPEAEHWVVGPDTEQLQRCLEGIPVRRLALETSPAAPYQFLMSWDSLKQTVGDLLVLSGRTPRIKTETLGWIVEEHRQSGAAITVLASPSSQGSNLGRIVRSSDGQVEAILAGSEATEAQRDALELDTGIHCFRCADLLLTLDQINTGKTPVSIATLVETSRRSGGRIAALAHPDADELRGVYDFRELAAMNSALRNEKNQSLMDGGVTLLDPERTYVDFDVTVEKGAVLYPMVTLEGRSHIGTGSVVHSGTRIADSTIGPGVEILDCCVIVKSEVGADSTLGPFAHLRSQVKIGEKCRIGNYVELKKSQFGDGSKAAHLAYLGDATLGDKVNIGAGTITCNYDGVHKHPTIIEDGVFVGTDSQLVAPVRIGKGSYIAAGSCITDDVPPESLAIARSRQTNKTGWKRRRKETQS
jgi:bifunctional UDP-N-acetylglucosamine pyrophosphorylase/glucosamine-1-phosphate N-acetyltransferase